MALAEFVVRAWRQTEEEDGVPQGEGPEHTRSPPPRPVPGTSPPAVEALV